MTIEDNKQIVRRYQEPSNANDLDDLVAPNLVSRNATPGVPRPALPRQWSVVSGQWPVAGNQGTL
jgi:hypothetical protein